jgi:hypothetical protein
MRRPRFWIAWLNEKLSERATHVSRTGAFQFSRLDDDDYFLLVVVGQEIVQTRSFKILGNKRVSLNLEER